MVSLRQFKPRHSACLLAAPTTACWPSLCSGVCSLPGCIAQLHHAFTCCTNAHRIAPWLQCCKHACQQVAHTVPHWLPYPCLNIVQQRSMCPWLPPPIVPCLHRLQQHSLRLWRHGASMPYPSRPSTASAHSLPGCLVQADTQFQPLAQQLLERHKPELCSQPPEARDIRMVCPSRGGESRCRPSCGLEGGVHHGLLSARCPYPAEDL